MAIAGHRVEVFTQVFDEGMTREEVARWVDPDTMKAYPSYLCEIRETMRVPPFTETTRAVRFTDSEVTLSETGELRRFVLRKKVGAA